jgi:hypothetical protein
MKDKFKIIGIIMTVLGFGMVALIELYEDRK